MKEDLPLFPHFSPYSSYCSTFFSHVSSSPKISAMKKDFILTNNFNVWAFNSNVVFKLSLLAKSGTCFCPFLCVFKTLCEFWRNAPPSYLWQPFAIMHPRSVNDKSERVDLLRLGAGQLSR